MAVILRKLYEGYNMLNTEWSDPRTTHWPMIGSPIPVAILLGCYLYFVNNLGPKLMQHRQPFKLRNVMIIYNTLQIFVCSWIVWRSFSLAWAGKYRLVCEPVNYGWDDRSIQIAVCTYAYYIVKLSDLLDTVFFVLKKKNSHITFLHVYHHTGMVLLVWFAVKYVPGGHGTLLGVINSIVHIVMYAYYLLTIIDEKYKGSIWWKKHITQLQILQFLILVLHFSTLIFHPNCEYPVWIAAFMIPQNFFMLMLFLDFYRKTYLKKPSTNGHSSHPENKAQVMGNGDKRENPEASSSTNGYVYLNQGSERKEKSN